MKRLIVLGFGLVLAAVMSGCCCTPCCSSGWGSGCGFGGCGPSGCGVQGGIPAAANYAPACASCAAY